MKTEERKAKGLPVDSIQHSGGAPTKDGDSKPARPQFGNNRPLGKYNAFIELDKMRKGIPGNLAPIPDEVAVIGKAIPVVQTDLKRRREADDGDHRDYKRQNIEVSPLFFLL